MIVNLFTYLLIYLFIFVGHLLQVGSGEFSHPADTLFQRACSMASLMLSPLTTSSKNAMNDSLRCWNEDFIGLLSEDRDVHSLQIATKPDMVETFLTYADYLFLGLLLYS